jgi:hypothetical protein
MGARVLEEELPVGMAGSAFTEQGELAEPELRERLVDVVENLVREVESPLEETSVRT